MDINATLFVQSATFVIFCLLVINLIWRNFKKAMNKNEEPSSNNDTIVRK